MFIGPHERLPFAIFIFYCRRSRIASRAIDDILSKFMKIGRGDWLRVGQFPCEDWGYSYFVGLDVDVRGDDRSRSIVDSFALLSSGELKK